MNDRTDHTSIMNEHIELETGPQTRLINQRAGQFNIIYLLCQQYILKVISSLVLTMVPTCQNQALFAKKQDSVLLNKGVSLAFI